MWVSLLLQGYRTVTNRFADAGARWARSFWNWLPKRVLASFKVFSYLDVRLCMHVRLLLLKITNKKFISCLKLAQDEPEENSSCNHGYDEEDLDARAEIHYELGISRARGMHDCMDRRILTRSDMRYEMESSVWGNLKALILPWRVCSLLCNAHQCAFFHFEHFKKDGRESAVQTTNTWCF